VKLEVVTVGTELLLGYTLDTNAVDLGRTLAAAGIAIARRTSVPDHSAAVRDAVREALDRTGAVLTTGGLGPTRDDLTKVAVAELLGRPLRLDAAQLARIEERFRRLGRPMPAANRSQAEVPDGAVVLPNSRGTAPGLWLEDERGRLVIMLPGVPHEMRGLLVEDVVPRLVARGRDGAAPRVVRSRTLRSTGLPESAVADALAGMEEQIAPLTLAYLPGPAGVDLRVTAWDLPAEDAERRLADAVTRLRAVLGVRCYGEESTDLAAVVLDLLRRGGERLAVAESCTGGLLGARLTAVPGASDTFVGGVIAYADAVKTAELGVPAETLARHGAVSEETVRAMAESVARRHDVPCAMAITGIAGPTGGTADKPVGTVWLAARRGARIRAVRRLFPGDRAEIRARSAQAALDLLRHVILET
jgi:nicotinamide-nucleotide amidase